MNGSPPVSDPVAFALSSRTGSLWKIAKRARSIGVYKDCRNCKYLGVPGYKTPCLNCVEDKNWEPKETAPLERFCGTCNHINLGFSEEPCVTCLTSEKSSQWEPEEDVEEADERIYCPFPNGGQLYCRQERCGIWAVDGRTGTGMCALVMIAGKVAGR